MKQSAFGTVVDPMETLPSGAPVGSELLCGPELPESTVGTMSSIYYPAKKRHHNILLITLNLICIL